MYSNYFYSVLVNYSVVLFIDLTNALIFLILFFFCVAISAVSYTLWLSLFILLSSVAYEGLLHRKSRLEDFAFSSYHLAK